MNSKPGETTRCLFEAFTSKTQTLTLFEFASKTARNEDLFEVADLLATVASHERSHAKNFYRAITSPVSAEVDMPHLPLSDTRSFLVAALSLKQKRGKELYPGYEAIARKEECDDVAVLFRAIGRAEIYHARLLAEQFARIDGDSLFNCQEPVLWVCRKCGYPHEGTAPPPRCPGCRHPRQWFSAV